MKSDYIKTQIKVVCQLSKSTIKMATIIINDTPYQYYIYRGVVLFFEGIVEKRLLIPPPILIPPNRIKGGLFFNQKVILLT